MGRVQFIGQLQTDCIACTACPLYRQRTGPPVIYRGDIYSPVMLTGEAPGLREEQQGKPFVGPAGELLEKWLNWIGYSSNQFYITNSGKCRPTSNVKGRENLTPAITAVRTCFNKHLIREIQELKPKLIIACGKTAATVLGIIKSSEPIGPVLNQVKQLGIAGQTINCFTMRHPASLLHAQHSNSYSLLRAEYIKCFRELKDLLSQIISI